MTITHGYCTVADIKHTNRLAINDSDSVSDDMLEGIIEAVSRRIDDECHRWFFSDSDEVARYYTASNSNYLFTDDIASPSSDVSVDTKSSQNSGYDISWSDSDFALEPFNAEMDGVPYQKIGVFSGAKSFPIKTVKGVKVTAKFGWASVPKPIQQATMLQSERLFKRFSTPLGSQAMTAFGATYLSIPKLDPDVEVLISRYIKPSFG